MRRATIAGMLLLTGCYSIDDVRQQPAAWSASYPVAYEAMANCLGAQYANEYSVLPQFDREAGRATVILSNNAASAVLAEYQVNRTASGGSEVTWRHMGSGPKAIRPVDRTARERADRCGAAS